MKILFITSSRLGDAVLSTSILHTLEKHDKNLDVTIVSGSLPANLFKAIPFCKKNHCDEKKIFLASLVSALEEGLPL